MKKEYEVSFDVHFDVNRDVMAESEEEAIAIAKAEVLDELINVQGVDKKDVTFKYEQADEIEYEEPKKEKE